MSMHLCSVRAAQHIHGHHRHVITQNFLALDTHKVPPRVRHKNPTWHSPTSSGLGRKRNSPDNTLQLRTAHVPPKHRIKEKLSICQSWLCLDLVSRMKTQAPLLVVPFRQSLHVSGLRPCSSQNAKTVISGEALKEP